MVSNAPRNFKHPVLQPEPVDSARLITADELTESAMPNETVTQVRWRGMNLIIRRNICMHDALLLADTVACRCWDGEFYNTVLVDFYFRAAVAAFYSNLEIPQDGETAWALLYGTDLYDTILKYVNVQQINMLRDSVKTMTSN